MQTQKAWLSEPELASLVKAPTSVRHEHLHHPGHGHVLRTANTTVLNDQQTALCAWCVATQTSDKKGRATTVRIR